MFFSLKLAAAVMLSLFLCAECNPSGNNENQGGDNGEIPIVRDPNNPVLKKLDNILPDREKDLIIKEALDSGASLNVANDLNQNPLHLWFKDRTTALDSALVERALKNAPGLLNKLDTLSNKTPFAIIIGSHKYYKWLSLELFKIFLNNGADLNADFGVGDKLLHVLISGHLVVSLGPINQTTEYESILNFAFDRPEVKAQLNAQNADGSTPLHLVTAQFPIDLFIKFWEAGADPNIKEANPGIITGKYQPVVDFADDGLYLSNKGRSYLFYLIKNGKNSDATIRLNEARSTIEKKTNFAKPDFLKLAAPFFVDVGVKKLFHWVYIEGRFFFSNEIYNLDVDVEINSSGLDLSATNPDNNENILHYFLRRSWQPPTHPDVPKPATIDDIAKRDIGLKVQAATVQLFQKDGFIWKELPFKGTPLDVAKLIKSRFESGVNSGDFTDAGSVKVTFLKQIVSDLS